MKEVEEYTTMSKITITMDSVADLTAELKKQYNIEQDQVIPTGIVLGGEVLLDGIEAGPADVHKAIKEGLSPKTNAPLELDYKAIFEKYTADGGSVIHVSISGALSASLSNAKRAAEGNENVYFIDSKSLAGGIGHLVLNIKKLIDSGMPVKEVVAEAEKIRDNMDMSFIIKDLKYLHRGGRASSLKLLGANILKIRPSLYMETDGKLVTGKKYKGDFVSAVKEYVGVKIAENASNVDRRVIIIQSEQTSSEVEPMVAEMLKAANFEPIVLPAGAAITIHCGYDAIGLSFKRI